MLMVFAVWLWLEMWEGIELNPVWVDTLSIAYVIINIKNFVRGIYSYEPETNGVTSVYSVTAVLYLQLGTWNKRCH
jgi:hypothetical protein